MKRTRDAECDFTSSDIIKMVDDIRANSLTMVERKSEYSKKYPEFFENMPTLAESSCDPDFDYTRFKFMLRLRDQVTNKEKTLENASIEVGQTLFDHYVKPHIQEPNKM